MSTFEKRLAAEFQATRKIFACALKTKQNKSKIKKTNKEEQKDDTE